LESIAKAGFEIATPFRARDDTLGVIARSPGSTAATGATKQSRFCLCPGNFWTAIKRILFLSFLVSLISSNISGCATIPTKEADMNCNFGVKPREEHKFRSPGEFFLAAWDLRKHLFSGIVPVFFSSGRMDPAFREKVCLTVTWANRCRACMAVHSRWGKSAGVKEEEISDLETLDPARFEHREWVALMYARDYILFNGQPPDPEIAREFQDHYNEKERGDILAMIKMMDFSNRFNNTWDRERVKSGVGKESADTLK